MLEDLKYKNGAADEFAHGMQTRKGITQKNKWILLTSAP